MHVLSHSFVGQHFQAQLSCVLCLGSHKAKIQVLTGLYCHLEIGLGKIHFNFTQIFGGIENESAKGRVSYDVT